MNTQEFFAKFQDAINAEIKANFEAKDEYDAEQDNSDSGYEWQYPSLQPEDIHAYNKGMGRALEIFQETIVRYMANAMKK